VRASLDLAGAEGELRRLGPNGDDARELLDRIAAAIARDGGRAVLRALGYSRRGMSNDYRRRLAERDELLKACRREHFDRLHDLAAARLMRRNWMAYATGDAAKFDDKHGVDYPLETERWVWWRLRQLGWPPLGIDRLRHLIAG
jgi:hypothetical protein